MWPMVLKLWANRGVFNGVSFVFKPSSEMDLTASGVNEESDTWRIYSKLLRSRRKNLVNYCRDSSGQKLFQCDDLGECS